MRIRSFVAAFSLLLFVRPLVGQVTPDTRERQLTIFSAAPLGRSTIQPNYTIGGDTFGGSGGDLWLGVPPTGSSYPNPSVGLRATSTPISFYTSGSERMRIFADGRVDIGPVVSTSTLAGLHVYPSGSVSIGWNNDQGSRFYVYSGTPGGRAVLGIAETSFNTNGSNTVYGVQFDGRNNIVAGVTNDQGPIGAEIAAWNMGIANQPGGTATSAQGGRFIAGNYFDRNATVVTAYGVRAQVEKGMGTITTGYAFYAQAGTGAGTMANGYGLYIDNVGATNDWGIYQASADDDNYFAGNVLIGTTTNPAGMKLYVKGNSYFEGEVTGIKIRAQYRDVAEWVPSSEDLKPGTVVILDKRTGDTVMASRTAYDTAVAGVVSADPGVILGEESPTKEQVATTGRVRVMVDASKAPVEIGDLLVTSDIPGTAMKSIPVSVSGIAMHRPGTIIGKALEPLDKGQAEILVLLSLQ